MTVQQKIRLDFADPVLQVIHAKQGDAHTRFLRMALYNRGESVNPSGDSAVFKAKKPDGTVVIIEGTGISISGNEVAVTLPAQVAAVPGKVMCELVLIGAGGGNILGTYIFLLDVQAEAVHDNDVISEDYIDVLGQLISDANAILEAARAQAQAAASSAEDAAESAQEAADTAESMDVATINSRLSQLELDVTNLDSSILNLSADIYRDYVQKTTTVNGHALDDNITISRDDISGIVKSNGIASKTLGMSLNGTTLTITYN